MEKKTSLSPLFKSTYFHHFILSKKTILYNHFENLNYLGQQWPWRYEVYHSRQNGSWRRYHEALRILSSPAYTWKINLPMSQLGWQRNCIQKKTMRMDSSRTEESQVISFCCFLQFFQSTVRRSNSRVPPWGNTQKMGFTRVAAGHIWLQWDLAVVKEQNGILIASREVQGAGGRTVSGTNWAKRWWE